MILTFLIASIGFCGTDTPPGEGAPQGSDAPAAQEAEPVLETIQETTVGEVGGVRVPMGNMTQGSYTLPDGSETRGLICALALPDGAVFVGKGSVVEIGGDRWEVTAIAKPEGKLGSVTLKQLQ